MESLSSIKPFIRFVRFLTINEGDYSDFLVPYDSRLFFCLDDNGKITFENDEFQTRAGRVFLWKSGVKYMLSAKAEQPARFIAINFDFSSQFTHNSAPIPPDYEHNFKPCNLLKTPDFSDGLPFPVVLDDVFFLQKHMENMLKEYEGQRQHSQLMLSGMMQEP